MTVNHLKNKYQEDQTTKAIQYFLDFYYGNHMTNSQGKFDYHFLIDENQCFRFSFLLIIVSFEYKRIHKRFINASVLK